MLSGLPTDIDFANRRCRRATEDTCCHFVEDQATVPPEGGQGYTGAVENQHGVVIGLRSAIIGMQFNPSLIGVSIELEPGAR